MADSHDRAIEDSLLKTLMRMRQASGLRLKDLAPLVGVTYVTIWYWENGVNFPQSLARLRKLTEVLGGKLEIKVTTKDGVEFTY